MENLVEIIEACGKNGVSRLKMEGIEIDFSGFVIHDEKDYPKTVEKVDRNVTTDPNFQNQVDYENVQDNTENLLITDPLNYEESLFRDELEDSETHEDNE